MRLAIVQLSLAGLLVSNVAFAVDKPLTPQQ